MPRRDDWVRLDRVRWEHADGRFIARFWWGEPVYLLYASRREYMRIATGQVNAEMANSAESAAAWSAAKSAEYEWMADTLIHLVKGCE